jgi:hypothetical protein
VTVASAPPGIPGAPRLAGWIGRNISRIGDYVALGCFKLAVVLGGICARYVPHQAVGEGFEHDGLAVPTLVARAHQVLDADD